MIFQAINKAWHGFRIRFASVAEESLFNAVILGPEELRLFEAEVRDNVERSLHRFIETDVKGLSPRTFRGWEVLSSSTPGIRFAHIPPERGL